MRLTLIRHTSVDVAPGTCYGQTDVPVRSTFAEEAALTRQALAGKRFDKVYMSPLTRCVKLATYCGYGDAECDRRLLELNFGEWEMLRFEEITDPRLQLWYEDYEHVPATGGESFAQQYLRVAAFLDELRTKPYHDVALFVHGGVIGCAQVYAGMYAVEEAFCHLTPYGGVVEIELAML